MTRPKRNQKGFALLLVIGMVLMLSILAALTAYLVQRAQKMSSGQMRYSSALEAADASQDYVAQWIVTTSRDGNLDSITISRRMGNYATSASSKLQIIATLSGGDRGMAMGYEGMQGQVNRNSARYFSINSTASRYGAVAGHESEVARIETYRRDVIGE
jgi:hypothetical protein